MDLETRVLETFHTLNKTDKGGETDAEENNQAINVSNKDGDSRLQAVCSQQTIHPTPASTTDREGVSGPMPIVCTTDRPEVSDCISETVQLIGDEESNKLCASSISTLC
jgi:hypothetical protein